MMKSRFFRIVFFFVLCVCTTAIMMCLVCRKQQNEVTDAESIEYTCQNVIKSYVMLNSTTIEDFLYNVDIHTSSDTVLLIPPFPCIHCLNSLMECLQNANLLSIDILFPDYREDLMKYENLVFVRKMVPYHFTVEDSFNNWITTYSGLIFYKNSNYGIRDIYLFDELSSQFISDYFKTSSE